MVLLIRSHQTPLCYLITRNVRMCDEVTKVLFLPDFYTQFIQQMIKIVNSFIAQKQTFPFQLLAAFK